LEVREMERKDCIIILGLVYIVVILFLGLQLHPAFSQSIIENVTGGNSSVISNNTKESLAEKVIDPESLMLGAPDEAEENDTLGRMVDECGIIKPSSEMEEGEEIAECQERIINKTDATTTTTEGNER
jgi:hypothetical protein